MGVCYVYQSVFIAQISFLIGSTSSTWPSPMLIKFNGTDDNPLGRAITSTENSWLAALSTLGACIGALVYGALSSKFGRKTLLVSLGFPFLIFYLVMAWARTIWLFYISRFFTGFGLGGVFTIIPIYSAELADVNNRGILGASMTVFVNIGMLIPYCVGPFIPFFWFHIILAAIPAAYILLFIFFAPESPHFIIQKDHDAAEKILVKLRGSDEAARHLALIETELENVSNATILEIIKTKSLCKALLIGVGGFTFMQLTGTVVVASYTQTIFETAGGNIPPEIGPILVGTAQLITTMIVSPIADNFHRKFLLTISHLGVSLTTIVLGIYFFLKDRGNDVSSISILPLICLMLYVSVYNVGIGPVLLTFLGELFPPRVKGLAVSCLVVYNWGTSFLVTLSFNKLSEWMGMGPLLWMFATTGIIAVFFIRFCMIETKGKTFQEIQDELSK